MDDAKISLSLRGLGAKSKRGVEGCPTLMKVVEIPRDKDWKMTGAEFGARVSIGFRIGIVVYRSLRSVVAAWR